MALFSWRYFLLSSLGLQVAALRQDKDTRLSRNLESVKCTIVEKHFHPAAWVDGDVDAEEIPETFEADCGQPYGYLPIYAGEINDMEYLIDAYFDDVYPVAGSKNIVVPVSAIVKKADGSTVIDLEKIDAVQIEENASGRYLQDGRVSRSLDVTEGTYTVLVIRVVLADGAPSKSVAQLSDDVFGTGSDQYNLKSGYEACSGNKLKFNPAVGTDITNGVYELRMNSYSGSGVDSGTVAWAAVGAMPSGMTDAYDYTYYVLPGNVDFGGAAAWAYLPGTMSAYRDGYGSTYIVMLHELGHNLGHHHSGLGAQPYGDSSCWMGAHSYQDEGPDACFNGAKSWWFDWYSKSQDNPADGALDMKLVPIEDYLQEKASSSQYTVAARLNDASPSASGSNDDLYLLYNRKKGVTSGVVAYGDKVTVTEQPGAREISWHQAALGVGESYRRNNWRGSGKTLVIEVCSMTMGSDTVPDVARVIAYVEGVNSASCAPIGPTSAPTSSPTCASTGLSASLTLTTDDWPAEITWKIENTATNTEIATSPTYTTAQQRQTFDYSFDCLDPSCYKFTISDGFGDGLIETQGGYYSFKVNGEEIATSDDNANGNYGSGESAEFGSCASEPTKAPTDSTSSPTDSPTSSPTDSPTASPTASPTSSPSSKPTTSPTASPTSSPTASPTEGGTTGIGCFSNDYKTCLPDGFVPAAKCTRVWLPDGAETGECSALWAECTGGDDDSCCGPATCAGDASYAICAPESTPSPTASPTASPTEKTCDLTCDDKGPDCASLSAASLKKKCGRAAWITKKKCRLSCYNAGYGYNGEVCCNGTA